MPASDSRSDEELMSAYIAGEEQAFRLLYERYATLIFRSARRHLRSDDDALDLVQQTFLNVHRARRDFRASARFRSWLFTISLNLRREHFRRLMRRRESVLGEEGQEEPAVAPVVNDLSLDAKRRVREALRGLPESQSEVIRLHWYEGFTFQEIAELVGASVSAVKVRAHRGYVALRQALAPDTRGGSR